MGGNERGCSAIAAVRDRTGSPRGFQQLRQHDLVGIGETGFLAADRPHAHALLDRVAAVLDDALLQRPRLAARMLEIQIGGVDPRPHQLAEHALEVAGGDAAGGQQLAFGEGDQ